MKFIKSYYRILSVLSFVFFMMLAHIVAPKSYHFWTRPISALGAQGYDLKIIMQLAFLSFGVILSIGIIINGLSWRAAPILIYALSLGMTGIFCAKPFFDSVIVYSERQSTLHSVFAQLAAISFGIGILFQMPSSTSKRRIIHLVFLLALAGIALSITFGPFKSNQGIAQRLLFLISFIWLIKFYRA